MPQTPVKHIEPVLSQFPEVTTWSPFVSGQILIGRGKHSAGATVKGIDPIKEPKVANLKGGLLRGQWTDLGEEDSIAKSEKPNIILGQELARSIGARLST